MARPITPRAMRPPTTKGHLRRTLGSAVCLSGCCAGPLEDVSILLPSLCTSFPRSKIVGQVDRAAPDHEDYKAGAIGARAGRPKGGSGSPASAGDVLQDVVLGGLW